MADDDDSVIVQSRTISPPINETKFEYYSDFVLGLAFLITTIVAAKRMALSRKQGGAETTVVTAFYSLILVTSLLRTAWFLIPSTVVMPSYTPAAVMAFSGKGWLGAFLDEVLVSLGSLFLFSIFILILVYWADILKKYFYPGARRSKPMVAFIVLITILAVIQIINATMFLLRRYSVEGMLLCNSILLAVVSIVCVCEISIFSYRFRTVLKTLGAINQVSTESQVKRIVWITVTGNTFFFTRAFLETVFAIILLIYYVDSGSVDKVFSHAIWDSYILLKHWSEVAILCLMLYILQSRFTSTAMSTGDSDREGYERVSGTDDYEQKASNIVV